MPRTVGSMLLSVLMRLRELEVLNKVAATGRLDIVAGQKNPNETGLVDKVFKLL